MESFRPRRYEDDRKRYELELHEYEVKYGPIEKKKRKNFVNRGHDSENSEEEEDRQRNKERAAKNRQVDDSDEGEDQDRNQRHKLLKNKQGKPAPPKRPLTPFFLYKVDQFENVKREYPDSKLTEIIKIIAEKWRALDQEITQEYVRRNEEEKKRYEQELQEYQFKYGPLEKKNRLRKNRNIAKTNSEDGNLDIQNANSPPNNEDNDEEGIGEPCNKVYIPV